MAITPRQLQDAVNSIKQCMPNGDPLSAELLGKICDKLETLIDTISGKEDFELKTINGPKYCCADGSVYITFICQKWVEGVKDSEEVLIVGPGLQLLTELPACAEICDNEPCDPKQGPDLDEFHCYNINKPACCVIKIETSAGEVTLPRKLTTYSACFDCLVTDFKVTIVSGDCKESDIWVDLIKKF